MNEVTLLGCAYELSVRCATWALSNLPWQQNSQNTSRVPSTDGERLVRDQPSCLHTLYVQQWKFRLALPVQPPCNSLYRNIPQKHTHTVARSNYMSTRQRRLCFDADEYPTVNHALCRPDVSSERYPWVETLCYHSRHGTVFRGHDGIYRNMCLHESSNPTCSQDHTLLLPLVYCSVSQQWHIYPAAGHTRMSSAAN